MVGHLGVTSKVCVVSFGGNENVLKPNTTKQNLIKATHLYFEWVDGMVCELYSNVTAKGVWLHPYLGPDSPLTGHLSTLGSWSHSMSWLQAELP